MFAALIAPGKKQADRQISSIDNERPAVAAGAERLVFRLDLQLIIEAQCPDIVIDHHTIELECAHASVGHASGSPDLRHSEIDRGGRYAHAVEPADPGQR